MPLLSNFNVKPYYEDFDEDKKYLRILFKPGYSVQARELTQLQTILQNQIERFGNNIFVNGTPIVGASATAQDLISIQLKSVDINGDVVDTNDFLNRTIYSYDENTNFNQGVADSQPIGRAKVIAVANEDLETSEAPILLVQHLWGELQSNSKFFKKKQYLKCTASDGGYRIVQILNDNNAVGVGQSFSITEGVFYYGGFFIKNDAQSVIVDKYSTDSATVRVGFQIEESFYDYTDDPSLFDPAQQSTNYQAPGADRYFVDLVLTVRQVDSTDDLENFIELARFTDGNLQKIVKDTVYNKIGQEMAKRTFEESGNYVVKKFNLSAKANTENSTKYDLIVSPGKAYVKGYGVEVDFSQKVTLDAARDIEKDPVKKTITANYGSYFLTTNHSNSFTTSTQSLVSVDLHCVTTGDIDTASAGKIANTKIGTARIKSEEYSSAGSLLLSNTYIYTDEVFDLNVSNIVGTVQSGSTKTLIGLGANFSSITDAYVGATLSITTGPGQNEGPKLITSYNATSKQANVFPSFITTPTTASNFSIDFTIKDIRSLVRLSGTNIISSADISDTRGVVPQTKTTTKDAVIFDSLNEQLIFNLGSEYVAPATMSTVRYTYSKVFSGTLSGGSLTINSGGPDTFEELSLQNYKLVCKSVGGSSYNVGDIIPEGSFNITGSGGTSITLNVDSGVSMGFDLVATLTTDAGPKTKTLVLANTTHIDTSLTTVATGIFTSSDYGQVVIDADQIVRTPETDQILYLNDAIKLVKVLDFKGNAVNTSNIEDATDVTSKYTLDNGQKDSYYDNASISLKPGNRAPTGPIVIFIDRYKHPNNSEGFFSLESYPSYANIPSYISASGKTYNLRDCFDFRPAIVEETTTKTFNIPSTGPKIPKRNSKIFFSCKKYLPRTDILTLSSDGLLNIKKGISSNHPKLPDVPSNCIGLYRLELNPYTASVLDISKIELPNKVYTMNDIGVLENRIEKLEYYSTLSLLENDALSKTDVSLYGRSKNGVLTDSFVDYGVCDFTSLDFSAALNTRYFEQNELRPPLKVNTFGLVLDETISENFNRESGLVFLHSTDIEFMKQNAATDFISVNPFNVQVYNGTMTLIPESDYWVDQKKLPDNIIKDQATIDNLNKLITENEKEWTTEVWGSWQWENNKAPPVRDWGYKERSGTKTSYFVETVNVDLGTNVVGTELRPYMRAKPITFKASALKPLSNYYAFFDDDSVIKRTKALNYLTLNSTDLGYKDSSSNPETVIIKQDGQILATAKAILKSNSRLYIEPAGVDETTKKPFEFLLTNTINWSANASKIFVEGTVSKFNVNLSSQNTFFFSSGNINTSVTPTTTTFKLPPEANSAFKYVTGTDVPVYIVAGTGAGQSSKISSYNETTRIVTLTTALTKVPDSTTVVQIGNLKSDIHGKLAGKFYLPNSTFNTGESTFRLTNSSTNGQGETISIADASFHSQGILEVVQKDILSTGRLQKRTEAIYEKSSIKYQNDPLAQTFFVDPRYYPDGVFLSKIRLCFKSKDDDLPVTVQLRPSVNGYPSASEIYPYSTVSLTPDKVKISETPNIEDINKYTEFQFEAPVYLTSGEHAIVVLSNAKEYETWIAKKGNKDVNTNSVVNKEPNLGSFFKSQNGFTWTADQSSDLMFQLFRKKFETQNKATVIFSLDKQDVADRLGTGTSAANANVDILVLNTQHLTPSGATVNYSFNGFNVDSTSTGFVPIEDNIEVYMLDSYGKRIIDPQKGSEPLYVMAELSTNRDSISPVINLERMSIHAIEQEINNLGISNSDITVSNVGYYTNKTGISVSISGGGGNGATAIANVVSSGGANIIDKIIVTNSGQGYVRSPTITISGGVSTYPALAYVNGENQRTYGNSKVRYLTKKVTLADGFSSGDLRVYLTVHKPAKSNVDVYYKILSNGDSDSWSKPKWQHMTQINEQDYYSKSFNDYAELTFAPGINGVANNKVEYTSSYSGKFNEFNTFAIKIVLSGEDSVDVPRVHSLRAIALPAE